MIAFLRPTARCAVHRIHPLEDPRWDEFVSQSSESSIFHTCAWLEALRRTYGYQPVVFTTSPDDARIQNGLVFCLVESWLTGSRLVSLPFSDHCKPLVNDPAEMQLLFSDAQQQVIRQKLNYLELRPRALLQPRTGLVHSQYSYCFHQLDLSPRLDTLFAGFHKDSTQRKIRRAQREGLTYEEGRSPAFVDAFYRLLLLTRRRHQVPPQPRQWFHNLADCLGDRLKVRLVSSQGQPIAAMLTLRHKNTLMYKYGASDAHFHNLGPMHLLFWKCIQEGKREGMSVFDLGRSQSSDAGLITFKDRWGSVRSTLTYSRYGPPGRWEYRSDKAWKERIARRVASFLPDPLLEAAGRLLYRHIG